LGGLNSADDCTKIETTYQRDMAISGKELVGWQMLSNSVCKKHRQSLVRRSASKEVCGRGDSGRSKYGR